MTRGGDQTRRAAIIGLLSALSIATNYALTGVPNVKLMDSVVFLAGLSLGPIDGIAVASLTWTVYGFFNPYGFVPTVWVATVLGEWVYALAGWISGRAGGGVRSSTLAAVGFLTTLAYDILTNAAFALTFGLPVRAALVAGIPFALIHELSNAATFSLLVPKAESLVGLLLGSGARGPVRADRL